MFKGLILGRKSDKITLKIIGAHKTPQKCKFKILRYYKVYTTQKAQNSKYGKIGNSWVSYLYDKLIIFQSD